MPARKLPEKSFEIQFEIFFEQWFENCSQIGAEYQFWFSYQKIKSAASALRKISQLGTLSPQYSRAIEAPQFSYILFIFIYMIWNEWCGTATNWAIHLVADRKNQSNLIIIKQ